jgi:hypothetical protein
MQRLSVDAIEVLVIRMRGIDYRFECDLSLVDQSRITVKFPLPASAALESQAPRSATLAPTLDPWQALQPASA